LRTIDTGTPPPTATDSGALATTTVRVVVVAAAPAEMTWPLRKISRAVAISIPPHTWAGNPSHVTVTVAVGAALVIGPNDAKACSGG
jgi:hypothetical protein